MNLFTKEYYQSNNYENYLDRQEKYRKTATEITDLLHSIGMLNRSDTVLDYGCAVGFLSKALLDLGYTTHSFDISEWAISQARDKGCHCVDRLGQHYQLGFFLDVLEHMSKEDIDVLFSKTKFDRMIVRIPVSEPTDPKKFHLEVSRKDPTHINCATSMQWTAKFAEWGYCRCYRLNLKTIYDSPGCFCALLIR